MLGHCLLLHDGRGWRPQLVEGAEDLRRHRDPAPGARRGDECGVHERETAPLAGEALDDLRPVARLLEGVLQQVRRAEPLLMLLWEQQVREALVEVLLQALHGGGVPAPKGGR